jgi:Flp pilus assembly secretin CpaC
MMALFHAYRGPRVRSLAFSFALGVTALAAPAIAADINIVLDQAKLVKLPERVATIVLGNPSIADASVQSGGQMVVTGKGHGTTNVLVLDRAGTINKVLPVFAALSANNTTIPKHIFAKSLRSAVRPPRRWVS